VRDVNHPPHLALMLKKEYFCISTTPLRLHALLQDEIEVCLCLCKCSLVSYVDVGAQSLFGGQLLLAYCVSFVFCHFEFSIVSFYIDFLVGSDLW